LTNLVNVVTYNGGIFGRWALNSVLYSGVGAVVATICSLAAGYCLSKFTFRGREVWFNIILAGVMIPGTALALPLFLLMSQVGLVNTYWSVLLPSLVSPFGVYLGRIYAQAAVPDSLLEASRLDGAGEFRIFFTLVLRLMMPAAVTIFLFQFIGIWNNFFCRSSCSPTRASIQLPSVSSSGRVFQIVTPSCTNLPSVARSYPSSRS
jgi:multiple sugar transport system permease protein